MNDEQKREAIEQLLLRQGLSSEDAGEAASDAVESGAPVLESLCFQTLAVHILAKIHTTAWISNRAKDPSSEENEVIKKLIDSGAAPEDLAIFARMMQREYLSNLGCILDGAGIYGTPNLPCNDFRIFAVDDSETPQAKLDDLHETLGWIDLETEMKLSQDSAVKK